MEVQALAALGMYLNFKVVFVFLLNISVIIFIILRL